MYRRLPVTCGPEGATVTDAHGNILLVMPHSLQIVVDGSVTHFAARTYVARAVAAAGAAAAVYEQDKHSKYVHRSVATRTIVQSFEFVSVSMKTYRRLGRSAMWLLGQGCA
jgi:hypothetical protein